MTLTKQKPRATTNHRKRVGAHHARDKHYVKSYWPYLPVFAVLGLGILANSLISQPRHSNVLGYATDASVETLLRQTNGDRTANGEPALELNTQLSNAAQAKANDMATRNYWSHETPDGQQPWVFITNAGYNYEAAGENLAYGFGSSAQIVDAWMHSPEHRANLLDSHYQDVGFGIASSPNYQGHGPATIVVAEYGEPVGIVNSAAGGATSLPTVLGDAMTVSRLQLLTPSSIAEILVSVLCGAAIALFFVRHALAWHKVLVRGEKFVLKHPFMDVFLIASAVVALLLANTAGTIL